LEKGWFTTKKEATTKAVGRMISRTEKGDWFTKTALNTKGTSKTISVLILEIRWWIRGVQKLRRLRVQGRLAWRKKTRVRLGEFKRRNYLWGRIPKWRQAGTGQIHLERWKIVFWSHKRLSNGGERTDDLYMLLI
jgi:hypothetical protein